MIVLKFGGSSICSENGLSNLSYTVKQHLSQNKKVILVISALIGGTDELVRMGTYAAEGKEEYLSLFQTFKERHINFIKTNIPGDLRSPTVFSANETFEDLKLILQGIFLLKELSPKTMDYLMSFGERFSSQIIKGYLSEKFRPEDIDYFDTRKLIKTDDNFGLAKVLFESTNQNIINAFQNPRKISILPGFISSTTKGETTTLGRGSSEYTATLIAKALDIKEIEIWTVVDGVMTADPRKVKQAFTIPQLTYEEAAEFCYFGAKILNSTAMQPAIDKNIRIKIKNIFKPDEEFTEICNQSTLGKFYVSGLSSISPVSVFQLKGQGDTDIVKTSSRLLNALSKERIEILLITQGSAERSVCFAIKAKFTENAKKILTAEFNLEINSSQLNLHADDKVYTAIAAIGTQLRLTHGVSGRLFRTLGKNGINVIAIALGASEFNISAIVEQKDESKALKALHDSFFLSDRTTIHLYLAGTGYVGGALLEQIKRQEEDFGKKDIEFKLIGIANSKKMHFSEEGIPLENWRYCYLNDCEDNNLDLFVAQMKKLNLPNTIFIDCTASEGIVRFYKDILKSSISIVSPNKKANSGSYSRYLSLQECAAKSNVKFFYETNVGAGLPVIGTLKDLMHSGDEIIRIEAVLSGTLSFIFNSFNEDRSFSQVVLDAKAKGYTEPDPRDDLNGMDFMRKLLILARESGLSIEADDIEMQSLVPEFCRKVATTEEFLQLLPQADTEFEELRKKAENNGKVLRYIGQIEDGKASISLQAVDEKHPFYSLSGSDNIISFTTKRYSDRPLVIKGPGAGTEVTAAGVLADIVRVASYLK